MRDLTYSSTEQKSSLLDLIFVNQPSFVVSSSVLSSLADHCPVEVLFSLKKNRLPKPCISQRFVYSEADIDGLHTALAGTDWNGLLCGSVCEATTAWTETFLDVCKRFVLLCGVRVGHTSKPWYSSYFKYLASCRDGLFKRSPGKDPSSAAMVAYRKLRNLFVSEMRAAEKRYFADLGQTLLSPDLNPQRWWSLAKPACGWSSSRQIPELLDTTRKLVTSPLEQATTLNNQFSRQCSASPSADACPVNCNEHFSVFNSHSRGGTNQAPKSTQWEKQR